MYSKVSEEEIRAGDSDFKKNNRGSNIIVLILGIILFSRFFQPYPIYNQSILNHIYILLSQIGTVYIVFRYILRGKISKFFIFILMYYFILLIATVWNGANIRRLIMGMYPIIGMCCMIEIESEKSYINLIRAFAWTLGSMALINTFSAILWRDGIEPEKYFAGVSNQLGLLYIFAIITIISYRRILGKRSKGIYLYFILSTLGLVLMDSANNLVSWGMLIILLVFENTRCGNKLVAFRRIIVIYTIIFISIVIFRAQNLFSFFIEDILNKSLTLTNRTNIWDIVINQLKEQPLTGYGVQDSSNIIYLYLVRPNKPLVNSTFSAHNQILQILYEGGVLILVPLLLIIDRTNKNIRKYIGDRRIQPLIIGLFSILMVLMMESPGIDIFLILICLISNFFRIDEYI